MRALWYWRVVRFKHLTAGFTAAVIPAVADADKDGNSDNPADQPDGKVVKTSWASLYQLKQSKRRNDCAWSLFVVVNSFSSTHILLV